MAGATLFLHLFFLGWSCCEFHSLPHKFWADDSPVQPVCFLHRLGTADSCWWLDDFDSGDVWVSERPGLARLEAAILLGVSHAVFGVHVFGRHVVGGFVVSCNWCRFGFAGCSELFCLDGRPVDKVIILFIYLLILCVCVFFFFLFSWFLNTLCRSVQASEDRFGMVHVVSLAEVAIAIILPRSLDNLTDILLRERVTDVALVLGLIFVLALWEFVVCETSRSLAQGQGVHALYAPVGPWKWVRKTVWMSCQFCGLTGVVVMALVARTIGVGKKETSQ